MMTDSALEISSQLKEVDLVFADYRDLGFREGEERNVHAMLGSQAIHDVPHYDKFCARAMELGLEMCTGEVGPVLRLAYMDQPNVHETLSGDKQNDPGYFLRIAMKAIVLDGRSPGVFLLESDRDGKRRLMWDTRWPHFVCPTSKFVFIRPR
jgi:hypothetical protein